MTSSDRPPTEAGRHEAARRRLHEAVADHARHTDRFRAAAGTSAELSAYMAVLAAGKRVAAANRWLEFAEWDGPAAQTSQVVDVPAAVVA